MYLCLSLCFLWPIQATNILPIGGLFAIFDEKGVVDTSQLEHASVFLQAVDEINKNPDILPNHELQVVMGTGATSMEIALSSHQMFQMNSFAGAVSALGNEKGSYATKLFAEADSMIVNSMTSDTSFGDPHLYPLKAQTMPIVSFQGMAYQALQCQLNLTRVALFILDDLDGIRFAVELSDGNYCPMNVLGEYFLPSYTTDFTETLLEAMKVEARIFIVFMKSPEAVRSLLEQGHELGLFRDGTQILLGETPGLSSALQGLDDQIVDEITKGLVTMQYSPDYSISTTPRGIQFYNSWLNQTSLGNCSTQVDAAGNKYLLSTPPAGGGAVAAPSCASLNFTAYRSGDSVLNPYAVLTYDAVYTLAWGLHHAIEKGLPLQATNLSQTIIDEVEFVGASGTIDIFEGMSDFDFIAKGNREVGLHFALLNFHLDAFLSTGEGFVPFALIEPDSGIVLCPSTWVCRRPDLVFDSGWMSAYPPYAFDGPPSIVKIGGLFSAFVDGGSTLDKENAEFLSMFLMAVDEINNKTDGIHDDLLPNTQLKITVVNSVSTAISGANAYADIKDSFYHTGVSGLVNTLSSDLVKSLNAYAMEDETFQILSTAQDSALADGLQYSYKSSTVPLDSFIGTVFQDFLCSNGIERIAILAEDSSFGIHSSLDLTDGSICSFKVLSSASFSPGTTDFTFVLNKIQKSGARVIVIFASSSDTATLLFQGRSHHQSFADESLFLTSESQSLSMKLERTHNLTKKEVANVLRGVVSASFFPDYGVKYGALGKPFLDRFLEFGASRLGSYTRNCKKFDDSGARLLLRNTETSKGCAELPFSSYLNGGEELDPSASLAYDATYALAWAIHFVLAASQPLTSANIRAAMYDSVKFDGVSGEIDITRGRLLQAGHNQGNRVSGVHYRLLNFNEAMYLGGLSSHSASTNSFATNTAPSEAFATFGLWSVEGGIEKCPESLDCSEGVVYANNPSTKIPSDTRPPILLVFGEGFRIFCFVLGGFVIFVSLVFLLLTIHFRKLADVQNSQEYMLYSILLGGVMAGGRVINSALPLSDKSCVAGFWLSNLSFWFVMMAFFLKSWRVNQLLAIKSIKRVRITANQILRYLLVSVMLMIGMLVLLTLVGVPHVHEVISESSNQDTVVPFCTMRHPEIQTTLYVIHALLLGTGLRLCWSLREVPKKFSDFHTIGSGELPSLLSSPRDLLTSHPNHSHPGDRHLEYLRDAHRVHARVAT
jgi:ABC-type branched-subunit amino acid transport system substrate-binding protein